MGKLLEFAEKNLRQSVREALSEHVEGDGKSRVIAIRNIRLARETAVRCGMTIDDADGIVLDAAREYYKSMKP